MKERAKTVDQNRTKDKNADTTQKISIDSLN